MDKHAHARQTTCRKVNRPQENRGGSGGLFFDSKDRRVSKEGSYLRATTHSRQLYRRTHQRERHHQHGVAQVETCKRAAKTMRHPQVNEQNEEPVGRGIKYGEREIARSLDGLYAAREAEKDCGDPAALAVRDHPPLQAPLEQSGSVPPQIQQKCRSADDRSEKQRARGPCRGFQLAAGVSHMAVRLKQEQPDRGNDGGTRQIEQPFERIDSKQVRNGQLLLAREKERPHGFAGAPKKENRREACEGHRVNRSETRGAQIPLANSPPQ